jgi:hypothetical protein
MLVRLQPGDPEVRAQVDHPLAGGDQHPGIRGGGAVGQRKEDDIEVGLGQRRRVGLDEGQSLVPAQEGRHDLGQRLARVGPRGHGREAGVRMTKEDVDQDFAGVTGGADNADFHGREGLGRERRNRGSNL